MANIESPQTYGEFYWAMEVEAKKAFSEHAEKEYGRVIGDLLDSTGLGSIIPPELQGFMSILRNPENPSWDEIQKPFLGLFSRAIGMAGGEQMAKPFEYEAAEKYLHERIDPNTAIRLYQRKKITEDFFQHRMHSAGYADSEASHLYNAAMPYPSMQEIIRYGRYHAAFDNPKDFVWAKHDIHPDDWEMWNWLSLQHLTTEQVQSIFRRGDTDKANAITRLGELGWEPDNRDTLLDLAYEFPNAMLLMQGQLMTDTPKEAILESISKAGIHPDYADTYFTGVLTKPSPEDIIAYQLRVDPFLGGLDKELSRVGTHPNYLPLYKELAHQIPPVNDIITMAVREAFTPAIAHRFGQYEGLPAEYVEWVGKKGLTKEWAERYWAAHWTLPSPQQGFSMLHRGIIGESDLNLLLRALDIMPFWRDKLIQLAYKPLTRVDVRRMHLLGTLDERGVNKAYRDVGYGKDNADKMTDFTVRYNRRSLARFTSGDVITAYVKRYIDASKARAILRDIGTKDSEIANIIQLATHKRNWAYTTQRIDAIENLYKKGKRDLQQTHTALMQQDLSTDHVTTLLDQWEGRVEAEKLSVWTTAQTLKFLQMGLIPPERATHELQLLGYDTEHIDIYIKSVTNETG